MTSLPSPTPDDSSDAELVASLGELGLTPNLSRAYVALLRHGSATASEIAVRAGVPRPKIYDILQSLDRYGLCTSGGSRVASWTAVSPDIALPELVRRRDQERKAQAGRDQELARLLVESLPEPADLAPAPESALIEALIGRARIAREFEALLERAEKTLDIVQAMPLVQTADRWNVVECSAIERGVEVRVLFTPETAKEPGRYTSLLAAGGEGRLSNNLALKLALRDGEEALVALRDPSFTSVDGDGMTSIRIMQPDLVAPLQTLFRREWRRGLPLPAES
jgi:HTH-type transcriptional regulator, sugar sensing transcriptional regulator